MGASHSAEAPKPAVAGTAVASDSSIRAHHALRVTVAGRVGLHDRRFETKQPITGSSGDCEAGLRVCHRITGRGRETIGHQAEQGEYEIAKTTANSEFKGDCGHVLKKTHNVTRGG